MATHHDFKHKCPVPALAEALQPYVKPRQEVTAIRQAVHATLPLTSIDITQPQLHPLPDRAPADPLRRAYWKALQAHRDAQSRYDSLKADLAKVSEDAAQSSQQNFAKDAFLRDDYLPLVQQREKQRKLAILDRTLSRVTGTGGDAISDTLDNVVKAELGDMPSPPSQSMYADRDSTSDAEVKISKLKRAILVTKQNVDRYRAECTALGDMESSQIDPQVELLALQDAHNTLTTWMETQLAVISQVTGQADDASNGSGLNSPALPPGAGHQARNDIEDLYEQYIDARQKLLEAIAHPSTTLHDNHSGRDPHPASDGEKKPRVTASEILLPYLSSILSTRLQEQNLVQQTTYLRHQLLGAEARNQDILTRLAEESHLLQENMPKAAARGTDWQRASREASVATEKFVKDRVEAGITATAAAAATLNAIQRLPISLERT